MAGIFLSGTARATTAPVILSLSYDSTYPSQYIGSTLDLYMTAVQPTQQFSVSVTADVAGSGGSVTLGGLFSGIVSGGAPIYVSDGIRTWDVTYTSGNSITIDNANLLGNVIDGSYVPASWVVSDYSLLVNTTFAVYTGTLVSNSTSQAELTVTVGQFAQVVVYDNASNGDLHTNDGIWTGQFTVPNNGTEVTSANFYGSCTVAGTVAANQNFQSSQTVSFDMELPQILTYSYSTTKSNYNGDLYLSSLCQTKSAANPANIQSDNAQAQFNFTVNKPNTTVNITIGPGNGTWPLVAKQLPPFIIPNGATSLNGWSMWSGDDGNQDFASDGVYPVYYYINDTNGLTGVTITSQIKVVSMKMNISDITMTPPLINTQPAQTQGVITTIHYNVDLVNDSGSSLASSLRVLGWDDVAVGAGINSPELMESTVWSMQNLSTLNQQGVQSPLNWSATDTSDDDATLANYFTSTPNTGTPPPIYQAPALFFSAPPIGDVQLYYPSGAADCTITVGSYIAQGDGILTNDWRTKGMTQLFATAGTNNNPTDISAFDRFGSQGVGYEWDGATPAQNNYRIDISSGLTGLAVTAINQPRLTVANISNPCDPSGPPEYIADNYHFWPQSVPELLGWPTQGDLITFQNTSAIFVVNSSANPTSDNTPPQFLSSSPAENAIVPPSGLGSYSASSPLSVQFQDQTAAFNTGGAYSYITLTGPNGSNVGGISSTNGGSPNGTIAIYFAPTDPLTTGGNYTMQAFTCNVNGLCVEQTVPFTIQDTTSPAIASNGVNLSSQLSSSLIPLSLFQTGAQGPYQNINAVSVSILMVNSTANTIDTADSNVSLYQISGTAKVPVTMVRQADSNVVYNSKGFITSETLNYTISSVLNYNGLFEVDTQTESVDASGTHFPGPAALAGGTNSPQFIVQPCVLCLDTLYANNPNANRPAITGFPPITVTAGGVNVLDTTVGAAKPVTLPAYAGFAFLQTANNNGQLQFYQSATPLTGTALVWTYSGVPAVTFTLYYDLNDLTATVGSNGTSITASDLEMVGWNGTSWTQVSGANLPSSAAPTNNACTVSPPNNSAAYIYYALAYASNLTNPSTPTPGGTAGTTPLATPMSFPSTRAFDPWNSNPLYQKARFYYATAAPASMEARVYDTSGGLIRDLTLGNGISASQSITDPVYGTVEYYFTWDGTNSAGTVVHNGIYLVRWTETGVDGSHNTLTRPVALIK